MSSVNPTIYQASLKPLEQNQSQAAKSEANVVPGNIFAQDSNSQVAGVRNLFSSAQSAFELASTNLNEAVDATNTSISRYNSQASNTNAANGRFQTAINKVNTLNDWISGLDKELGQTRASLTSIIMGIANTSSTIESAKTKLIELINVSIPTKKSARQAILDSQRSYNSAVSSKPGVTSSIQALASAITDIDTAIKALKGESTGTATVKRPKLDAQGNIVVDAKGNPVLEEGTLDTTGLDVAKIISDLEASKTKMIADKTKLENTETSLTSTISQGQSRNYAGELATINAEIAELETEKSELEAQLGINLDKLSSLTNQELNLVAKEREQNSALVGLTGQLLVAEAEEVDAKSRYEGETNRLSSRQAELRVASESQTDSEVVHTEAKTTFETAYAELQRLMGQTPERKGDLGMA